jgi:hypothetical protein
MEEKVEACPDSSVSSFAAQDTGSWQVNMQQDLIRRLGAGRRSGEGPVAR